MEPIQPVVLVGGRSRRFGRDKLREPIPGDPPGTWLVDRPIGALRSVFGPCVAAVGECDPGVAARFDRVIPDLHPGSGPMGGIVSALEHARCTIFVLSGDLPFIGASSVRRIVSTAMVHDRAHAVFARTKQLEPCIAIYRLAALPRLRQALDAEAPLHAALDDSVVHTVTLTDLEATNVNTPQVWPRTG